MTTLAYSWLKIFQTRQRLLQQILCEFLGTFILVLIIDCAVANYFFTLSSDHFAIAFAAGVGLYISVVFGATVGAGHVNPVVTLALATLKKTPWTAVPFYFLAQYAGGFVATVAVYMNNFINAQQNIYHNSTFPRVFMSFPSNYASDGIVIYDQVLCLIVLMFMIMALIDKSNNHNSLAALPIGLFLVLCAAVIGFGYNAGAAINPARDIPARIFMSLMGYDNVWKGFYWLSGSLLGPHIGAIIGAWLYYVFIEINRLPDETNEDAAEMARLSEKKP